MLTHAFIGLVLFFILFAAATWVVRWLQRRTGGALGRALGGGGDVRVVRRSPLGWHCSCVVVDVAGKQFAVALSRRGAITLLGEVA
ncbi:MAG TPA: flagellar biosynthetic protein FliO, partial [Rhodanobacteraceae bacterium]